jgi:hypothetical protein
MYNVSLSISRLNITLRCNEFACQLFRKQGSKTEYTMHSFPRLFCIAGKEDESFLDRGEFMAMAQVFGAVGSAPFTSFLDLLEII